MSLFNIQPEKKKPTERAEEQKLQLAAFPLNLILGGGMKLGKIYEWFGGEGSGKSTLAYETCAIAVRMGLIPVFYDMEDATTLERLAKFGLYPFQSYLEHLCREDQVNMYLVQDRVSIEHIFVHLNGLRDELRKQKKDARMFVVVDSVGASPPQAHVDAKDLQNSLKIGADALGWKMMLRIFNRSFLPQGHTLLLLNHQTQAINTGGFSRGPKYTSPGGHAVKHQAHTRMQIIRVASMKNQKGEQIGAEVKIKTLKNREAPPFQEVVLPLYFGNPDLPPGQDFVGTWDALACLMYCRARKLITNRGSKSFMWLLNDAGSDYEGCEWVGHQGFIDSVYSNDTLRRRLYATMRHAHYNSEQFSDGVIKPQGGPTTVIGYDSVGHVEHEPDEEDVEDPADDDDFFDDEE